MANWLKTLRWEWRDEIGRLNLLNAIWMRTPGNLGFAWRGQHLPRHFAAAGERIRIHEGVRFRGIHRLRCGDDVEIGVDNFLQASGGLVLGDRVMTGPGVQIWTVNHRFDDPDVPIAEQGYDYESVVIGDDCWLGAGVFVMPGVELPEGCIVAAHSVVARKKYRPWSILAGHPARVIGCRKPEVSAVLQEQH
jgi:acetyltransferase-like isoleucine patch superfamily enzyme